MLSPLCELAPWRGNAGTRGSAANAGNKTELKSKEACWTHFVSWQLGAGVLARDDLQLTQKQQRDSQNRVTSTGMLSPFCVLASVGGSAGMAGPAQPRRLVCGHDISCPSR
jgi:hypothetical protein